MRKLLVVAVMALSPAVTQAATKGAAADLGDQGTFSPFGSVSLSYSNTDSVATLSADFSPGVLYFVIDNLGVGGQVELSVSKPENTDSTSTVGVGPMVGYHVRFSQSLSLLPQGTLAYFHDSFPSSSRSTFGLLLYAPVLYRVSHFFLGFGPYLSADLYKSTSIGGRSRSDPKTFALGLRTTIGGWL